MTHADRIREAERAVVERAIQRRAAFNFSCVGRVSEWKQDLSDAADRLNEATDALLALRAATCPTCRGAARIMIAIDPEDYDPCPESCDAGKRRTT